MKVAIILAVVGLAALAAAATSPLQEQEYEFLFGRWVEQHGKVYESVDTFFKRYNVWKANMNHVIAHASKNKTYTLAMNAFGDLSNAEFKSMYNNYVPRAKKVAARRHATRRVAAPPTSVDWRKKGAVTPVKNQGQCGSCWAFSTTGSTEGAVHLATGKLLSLSEQQLVDCAGSTGNDGCNGGEMQAAMQYIINNGGICSEAAYPYTAQDGTCNTSCTNVATIKSFTSVTPNDEDALMTAVILTPTSVAVDAGGMDWQFYSGGVLADSGCGTQLDHGVLAVGYGTLGAQPYWIVKNSWGTSWGMSGYIEILKGHGQGQPGECGIAMDASYPTA